MLIRFNVNNFYSFGKPKEFNMLPSPRYRRLGHHEYNVKDDFSILKLSAIYGANGAGKSNLIKAISFLEDLVVNELIPFKTEDTKFKFNSISNSELQTLVIEFIQDEIPFVYGIEIQNSIIATEELYVSGLGKKGDQLIFERKTDKDRKTKLQFFSEFEEDVESQVLKKVIEKNLSKPNKTILKLLTTLDNEFLSLVNIAFKWFDDALQIITPDSRPKAMAQRIDLDKGFKSFARDLMSSFNVGIKDISTEKKPLEVFFGEDNIDEIEEYIRDLEGAEPGKMFSLRSHKGDELIVVKDEADGQVYVKQLKLEHEISTGESKSFSLEDESDGTIRLVDFIPAFKEVVSDRKVFIIDEFERSIHPLLIKELLKKFSFDAKSAGQLIFTTHESSLLDQSMFRQDEIWFAQKDNNGCTDLYSLSDFKEHNTIDVRKGYLNGRYGSIPFLGNLQDLNWHKYDFKE